MMRTSTPRLHDVARHVVVPSGIVKTGWPPVRAKLADMGLAFDPWQQGAAKIILGKREDGRYACSIGGAFMSIPRQVGKTFMIGSLVFALCMLNAGTTVIWTAHRTRTAAEVFQSMQGLARRKEIAPFVLRIVRANGEESIEFTNGSRILFGAREAGFGRGFSGVDIIVFDEAQILSEAATDDMIPATNQSKSEAGPLVLYVGTPPKPADLNKGTVFLDRRKEALSGESDDLVFIEFSADDECQPAEWGVRSIDWEQVAQANPSFPDRTKRDAILRMFKNLGPASFRREGLGIWDPGLDEQSTISAAQWAKLATQVPPDGVSALGVRFVGGEIALAGAVATPDGVHVEGIESHPLEDGTGWVVEFLADAWESASSIVVDGKEGVAPMIEELRKAGVRRSRIVQPTSDQVIAAHTTFLAAVNGGTLSHFNQAELNRQVATAGKRKIGAQGGWGWSPIGDGSVALLDAVTLAAWGARQKVHRKSSRSRSRGYSG